MGVVLAFDVSFEDESIGDVEFREVAIRIPYQHVASDVVLADPAQHTCHAQLKGRAALLCSLRCHALRDYVTRRCVVRV